MLVKVLMRSPVATVDPHASIDEVKAAMARDTVPEVPVVDGNGSFLGIVTARDVALASASTVPELAHWECRPVLHHVRVRDAMTEDRWAVPPDARVEDVAHDLAARWRDAAPILDDRRLVGLVTARQLLASLVRDLPVESFAGPRRIVVRVGYGDDEAAVLRVAADIVGDRHARVVVVRGDGVTTLLDAALREDADLIIAGAAVATALTRTAPCAVLAIPSSGGDGRADG